MTKGWVSIHRQISDNDLWLSEKFTRGQAWVDMILLANHKDGFVRVRGNKVDLKRGQLGWSKERLAERWQWSRKKVSSFLNELEKEQQIAQQKSLILSVVTIVNYDKFQENDATEVTTKEQQSAQQKNTNNKDNNKNNIPPIVPQGTEWVEGSLNEFYQYTPPEQFKEICIAAAEKKKVPTERAKREFEKFQTFWLDPSLSKAKAKKIDWKRAFQNWIGKIKFEPIKNNMEIAAEIHQNVMQNDIVKQCIAVGDPRLDSNLAFLKALNLGYTREQISKVIHQLCDNPPKNKIYSWSILNGYFS